MKTIYDVLGVRPDADIETVKRAFREAAKLHHPDLHPGDTDAANRFRRISAAYSVLCDAEQRAAYDELLAFDRQRIRSEWTRNILTGVISVAVFSVVSVVGLVWIKPLVLTSMEAGRVEQDAPRGPTEMAAAPPAVPIDAGTGGGHPDRTAASAETAILPNDAMPGTHAVDAEATASLGPVTGPPPDQTQSGREEGAAAPSGADVHQAIADPDKTIPPDPPDAKADNISGNDRVAASDPDRALADYDEAIRRDPNNPALFHDRGMIWRRKGDLDRALADMDRAIRFGFTDANLYNERGLIWLEKGRYHRAIADFERASKINPDLAGAAANRDIALRREDEVVRRSAGVDRDSH